MNQDEVGVGAYLEDNIYCIQNFHLGMYDDIRSEIKLYSDARAGGLICKCVRM